jgi:hypothetical protein
LKVFSDTFFAELFFSAEEVNSMYALAESVIILIASQRFNANSVCLPKQSPPYGLKNRLSGVLPRILAQCFQQKSRASM